MDIKQECLTKINDLKQLGFELKQIERSLLLKKAELSVLLRQFQQDYLNNPLINDGSIEFFDLDNTWQSLARLC